MYRLCYILSSDPEATVVTIKVDVDDRANGTVWNWVNSMVNIYESPGVIWFLTTASTDIGDVPGFA